MAVRITEETFEELLSRLQETVARLENEQLTLEDSIAAYEESVRIANACSAKLEAAELRVSRIDGESRIIREQATFYHSDYSAATLLLGDDEDDLADLLDDDE